MLQSYIRQWTVEVIHETETCSLSRVDLSSGGRYRLHRIKLFTNN